MSIWSALERPVQILDLTKIRDEAGIDSTAVLTALAVSPLTCAAMPKMVPG